MDFLTHILVGYLLGAGVFDAGALVWWTAVAAYAPDFDVFLWPLAKKYKLFRHRGITHSLPAGVLTVGLGSLVMWGLFGVPFHLALAAGAIGWVSHVVLDVFNWGCLLLWPWKTDIVEWTVQDHLTKPSLASALSLVALYLVATQGGPVSLSALETGLLVAWSGYFLWRVANKAYLTRHHGSDAHILPTARPLTWRVAVRRDTDIVEAALLEHRVLARRTTSVRVLHTSRYHAAAPEGPLTTEGHAAAFTHRHVPEVQELHADGRPLHYRAERHGDGWVVRWYALDSVYGPSCFGVEVTVTAHGEVEHSRRGVMPLPVTTTGVGAAA